jgi:hypothetical protein
MLSLPTLATITHAYTVLLEALRAMYIVPRTPSPVPLEERNVEDLTLEEMRELLRRQRVSLLCVVW